MTTAVVKDEILDLQVFVALDYSQAEIRILAEMSKDPLLVRQFREGRDIHCAVGHTLTGWSEERIAAEKKTRRLVKNMVFAIIYGVSREGLYDYVCVKIREQDGEKADLSDISQVKLSKLYDQFFARYVGVKRFIEEMRHMAEVKGHVDSMFGFRRELRDNDESRNTYWLNQAVNCIDFKTEILTKRGWLTGKQLQESDACLTDTGWQKPIAIRRFPSYKGPVHIWKSRSFSAVSTPNHRWKVRSNRNGKTKIVTSSEVLQHSGGIALYRTITNQIKAKGGYCWSDDFIRLCGWLLTDGYLSSCNGVGVGISQSKPDNVQRIQKLMDRLGIQTGYQSRGCWYWYLGGKWGKQLRELFPKRVLTETFISSLPRRQARLLIETMLLGDGNCEGGKREVLGCGTKEKADIFQMLCAWAGYASHQRKIKPSPPAVIKATGQLVTPTKPYYLTNVLRRGTAQVTKGQETIGKGNGVWCPTFADDAAWVARRDGGTYLTKNTPIQCTAHQLVLMAMALLDIKPVTYNRLQIPVKEVHDALYFYTLFRHLKETVEQGRQLLEHGVVQFAQEKFGIELKVPLIAEAEVGFCLGSLVPYTGQPLPQVLEEWRAEHKKVEKESWEKLLKNAAIGISDTTPVAKAPFRKFR